MDVILLERIEKLGGMGDVVKVRPGYARNFLLPQRKALRATKENLAYFEGQRAALEQDNERKRSEANDASETLDGMKLVVIRQAGASGQLYGSVSAKDIAEQLARDGARVERRMVQIESPIKMLGLYDIKVYLHPEVIVTVNVNVARSKEEAEMQAERGGMITAEMAEREALAEAEARAQALLAEIGGDPDFDDDEGEEQPAQKDSSAS